MYHLIVIGGVVYAAVRMALPRDRQHQG